MMLLKIIHIHERICQIQEIYPNLKGRIINQLRTVDFDGVCSVSD